MGALAGETVVNWNFCSPAILIYIPTYFLNLLVTATVLVSTPKNSLARYAALPINAYLSLRIYNAAHAAFPNNVVGLVEWGRGCYNLFLISSTLLYFENIDASDPVISKPVDGRPPSYFTRLWRALTYTINARGINTPYQIKNVPAFDSKRPGWVPSRRRFLITNTGWFIFLYLFQDLLNQRELTAEDEAKFMGINRENLFWRHPADGPPTGDEIGFRIYLIIMMWSFMIPTAVALFYTFYSLIGVGLGISEPKNWPPLFGSAKDSYTLRLLWGKFWHQTLRWHFSKPAQFLTHSVLRLPKTGLVQRYVNILFVFLLSGVMHAGGSYTMLRAFGPEIRQRQVKREFAFFIAMAVGIMVEDGIQWLFQSKKVRSGEEKEGYVLWKRIIGYIWVWGLMVLLAPFIDFPKIRARLPTYLPVHPLNALM